MSGSRQSTEITRDAIRSMEGKVGKISLKDIEDVLCPESSIRTDLRKMGFSLKTYKNHIYFSRDKFNMLGFDWKKI